MDKFIGKRLDGRYEIRELIGVGGMAVVYKAYDNIDDRIVAIKILKEEFLANEEFRRRFKNESKAIAVLSHPNIVRVYDVSFGDVLQYIVMEYISGITLKEYIEQQGIIGWRDAVHFATQVLKALQHAHDKGIVHRDIKPQNIMLLPNGTVKVTDFGIARFSRSEQKTITNKAIGSVHYISPEQARGDFTDGKADIYSVGVLLYEMTTGRVPFQADSAVSVAIMQLQNEPVHPTELNSLIPTGLEEIILKAMQKEPKNRYQTAQAMLDDLNAVMLNPATVFGYQYNMELEATKHIDLPVEPSAVPEDDEAAPAKAPVVPILAGIAAVFLVVMAIVGVIVWILMNNSGESMPCPKFVGMNYNDLVKDPEYKDYTFKVDDDNWEYTEYERGYIFKQSPEEGKMIKQKTAITLYVSLGPKENKLDDYAGILYTTAESELKDLDVKIDKKEIADAEIQKGFVIKTVPPAGATIKAGDTVTVYVSSGEEVIYVPVPIVTNMTKDQAKKLLEEKGLTLGNVTPKDDASIPEGIVISQDPSDGEIGLGRPVNIVVSTGRAPTTVGTTVSYKPVSITAPLPKSSDKIVDLTVWVDGMLVDSLSAKIDLSQRTEYPFSISGSTESSTVMIKLNNVNYLEYTANFIKGQADFIRQYDLPFLTTTTPPTTTPTTPPETTVAEPF